MIKETTNRYGDKIYNVNGTTIPENSSAYKFFIDPCTGKIYTDYPCEATTIETIAEFAEFIKKQAR